MKYLFDPAGVFTSALLRSVDIVLPEGTIVSALPPDGAVFLYYEQNQAMMAALLRAFAQALGPAALAGDHGGTEIHMAFGAHSDGTPWVSVAQCGGEIGPFGANAHGDADSQMLSYLANGIAVAAEAVESDVPVVMLRHEIVPDTGGPGYHRGGASIVRDTLWLAPAAHSLMTLRAKRAAGFGVNGGNDGTTGGVWVYEPSADGAAPWPVLGPDSYRDATPLAGVVHPETNAPDLSGRYIYPYALPTHPTAANSALRYLNHGGGGWGNPLQREPDRVKLDVRDGYVTIEGAARDYGVVGDPELDPEGLSVDVVETERLRSARGAV
jgi:N-methylhydantoinase B